MKISRSGVFMTVLVSLLFGSCASPPTLSAKPPEASAAANELPAVPTEADPPTIPADTSVPAGETSPLPAASAPETTESAGPPSDAILPESPESVPPLPPGERIVYFYPEPENLYVPPAPAATVPAKTVPEKAAPAVSPAPKAAVAPAVPKPASVPATVPAAKPEPVPAEKAVDAVLPGIWEGESAPIAAPEKAVPVAPSRKVALAAGQTLEVWYPGSGWVYLGDSSAQNGLAYETRKLDKTDTLFTFKAFRSGNYILDFSRFDLLEDAFSSDSLAVEVSDTASKRTEKIRAPNYRGADAAAGQTVTAPAAVTGAASTRTASATMTDEPGVVSALPSATAASAPSSITTTAVAGTSPVDAAAVLAQAKKALGANDPATALDLLDRFFTAAVSDLDEGWLLRGQAYEANGPVRDIRKALAAYETLVSAYPESARWKEADARIRYIKQFYLRIR